MPEGLEGVFTATNDALKSMDAEARRLARLIEESKASLVDLTQQKEAAMTALQAATAQTASLQTDLDTAWTTLQAKHADVEAKLNARAAALDAQQVSLDGQLTDLATATQHAGQAKADYLQTKADVVEKATALLQQLSDAVQPLL